MDVRQRITWTATALAVVFALCGPLTANAQFGREVPEPYTPAAGAKDLKSVLFNWTRNMGMLKGHDEREMVASHEYQGTGTIQVDGRPCTLTKYRVSTNYQSFSQRIQYACTRENGQTYSNVEVVSGFYAWDEDMPGAQIGPTKGKVTPKPAAVQERLIRMWGGPYGAAKAAIAGTTPDTFWLGANPGTLFDDGAMKVGHTSLTWEGGKPVLTFPIPAVPGATATATLNDKFMTESVVVTQGKTTTEFAYSDYRDWNNPLNKIDMFYAGKRVERRNGAVVRDLTTVQTESGNVYVVAPVPASVQAAIKVKEQLPHEVIAKEKPPIGDSPTPMLDGHPDLRGAWSHTDWIGNYMTGGGAAGAGALPRKLRAVAEPSTRPMTSSSTLRRGSAFWAAPSTSRNTGTRFSSSTCGPTNTTRS